MVSHGKISLHRVVRPQRGLSIDKKTLNFCPNVKNTSIKHGQQNSHAKSCSVRTLPPSNRIAEASVLQLAPVHRIQPVDGSRPFVVFGVHHHIHKLGEALGIKLLSSQFHDLGHKPWRIRHVRKLPKKQMRCGRC